MDDIKQMIYSAYYYPTLLSSVSFGGLRYLNQFKLVKEILKCFDGVKLCNVTINCNNLILSNNSNKLSANLNNNTDLANFNNLNESELAELESIEQDKFSTYLYTHWHSDVDLGAGVLNRFGSTKR